MAGVIWNALSFLVTNCKGRYVALFIVKFGVYRVGVEQKTIIFLVADIEHLYVICALLGLEESVGQC